MNKVYTEMIPDPKPARTCVAVAELPMGTDVSMLLLAKIHAHRFRSRSNAQLTCEYVDKYENRSDCHAYLAQK